MRKSLFYNIIFSGLFFIFSPVIIVHGQENAPPVVADIPGQSIDEGQDFNTIALDDYVDDPDNADSLINWTYSGNDNLTVNIGNNRVAAITAPEGWTGSETITFTATDPDGASDADAAKFTVNKVNAAPVVSDIPDQTVNQGQNFSSVSLDNFVSDPDNADNQITWTYSGNDNLTVSIDNNRVAAITAPEGWTGSETITFTATDPDGASDADTAKFTVNKVNVAPVVSNIPDQTVNQGQNFSNVSLDNFVSDPDNADNQITWTYSGNDNLTVSIDNNRVATINAPGGWTGSETVTFTATDPDGASDADAAKFTVNKVNAAPVVSDIPDQTVNQGQNFSSVSLDNFVSDPDNPDNQITWTYSGNDNLTVNIDNNRVAAIAAPEGWTGSETITFTATDPDGASDADAAKFTVNKVNAPPVVSDIPDQAVNQGQNFSTVSLDNFVSDPDNANNQITWTYSGNDNLTVSIDNNRVATINAPGGWTGSETITFTATDPDGASDADAAKFTVNKVNAPPVVEIPDQTINEGSSFGTINLDNYVSDPDNDDAELSWSFSGNKDLNVAISNHIATITTPSAEFSGTEIIRFTATDPGGLSGSDNVTFRVNAVNDAPVLSNIETSPLLFNRGNSLKITSEITVADLDNNNLNSASIKITGGYISGEDRLQFTAMQGISGSFNTSSGELRLTGSATKENYQAALRSIVYTNTGTATPGTRTISFTVNDGADNSNTLSRNIIVNAPPAISLSSAAFLYCSGSGPVTFQTSVSVSDADNSSLSRATVVISSDYSRGNDILSVSPPSGISASFDAASATLTLSGTASLAAYQQALNAVRFQTSEAGTGTRKISFTVSDGMINSNTAVKNIEVRPSIKVAGQNYFEDFEDDASGWHAGSSGNKNSWTLGNAPDVFPGQLQGSQYWHTEINIPAEEQSFVMSPCFDFSGSQKPAVVFDMMRRLGPSAGATLQYSVNNGLSWENIGVAGDGYNWFNNDNIPGSPGGQKTGWSDIKDESWTEAAHDLNVLKGKTGVIMRFAYGSDGASATTGGMAFDNFRISERNRVVLLEHFTNSSDASSKTADEALNSLAGKHENEIIDIQYHTAFPGPDPLNAAASAPSGARALYYGITSVPYSIMDGGYSDELVFDYISSPLTEKKVLAASLKESLFSIDVNTEIVTNMLNIKISAVALQQIPSREITLHVVVTEGKVTGITGSNGETEFRSVARTMLPDAAGTTFNKSWNRSEMLNLDLSWEISGIHDQDEIKVVAFMQDEQTKEVYQTSSDKLIFQTPVREIPLSDAGDMILFPDPADEKINIRFGVTPEKETRLEIYSSDGIRAGTYMVAPFLKEYTIDTYRYSPGTYFLKMITGNNLPVTKRFVILR